MYFFWFYLKMRSFLGPTKSFGGPSLCQVRERQCPLQVRGLTIGAVLGLTFLQRPLYARGSSPRQPQRHSYHHRPTRLQKGLVWSLWASLTSARALFQVPVKPVVGCGGACTWQLTLHAVGTNSRGLLLRRCHPRSPVRKSNTLRFGPYSYSAGSDLSLNHIEIFGEV